MNIRELYASAIDQKEDSLLLLLDFLLHAKKAVKFNDDVKVLEHYYQDRFRVKMNEYLNAHNEKTHIVKLEQPIEVFNIRSDKGRYFIAAYTRKHALMFFYNRIGGEVYSIHAEPLELPVYEQSMKEETKEKRWNMVLKHVKNIPAVLGYYDY
jgi:hypothetical protein